MNELEMFPGKRCVSCGRYFVVDPRVGERQKCCRREVCRKKRKRLQERAWKERNPGYFEGHYASYVKPWRAAHPGYQSGWRAQKRLRCKRGGEIKTQHGYPVTFLNCVDMDQRVHDRSCGVMHPGSNQLLTSLGDSFTISSVVN